MVRTRRCRRAETNPNVSKQKEWTDVTEGKVIVDYELDLDYKQGGLDPEIEPVDHEGEEENSNEQYSKM